MTTRHEFGGVLGRPFSGHSCGLPQFHGHSAWLMCEAMTGENRQLVTDEPVEFEKKPVEVQDCRKITDHFRGIYRIYPNLTKENWRM